MSPSSSSQPGTPPPAASANGSADELSVLSDVMQGLDNLKRVYAERQAMLAQFAQRETTLSQRETAAAQRETELSRRAAEVEELAGKQTQHAKAEQERIAKLARELEENQAKLEERRAAVEQGEGKLEQERATLKEMAGELEGRESALTRRQTQIAHEKQALEAARAEVITLERNAAEHARKAIALEKEILTLRTGADEATRAIEQARAQERQWQEKFAHAEQELAKARQESQGSAQAQQELAQLRAQVKELAEKAGQAESRAQELAKAQEQIAASRSELAEMTRKLEQAEQASAQRRALAEQGSQEAVTLRRQVDEAVKARAAAQEQLRLLQEQTQKHEQGRQGADQELAKLRKELEHSHAAARQLQQRVDELTANAASGGKADAELRGQLEALKTQHAQSQEQLDAARHELEALKGAVAQPTADTAALAKQVHVEKQRAAKLEHELAAAKLELKSFTKTVGASGHRLMNRLERLRRLKGMIREQTRKIRRASEALQKRYEQCEQVLAQRADLVAAKQAVELAHRQIQSKAARSRTGVIVFFGVAILTILGWAAWFLAEQLTPSMYAATAIIEADSRGRTLSQADLAQWQSYHEGMLNDPLFHKFAADRMAGRTITSLGTPGALQQWLKESVDVQSPSLGQLVFELRGRGADRTRRVLETFVLAFVSRATSAREQRVDGAVTIVKQEATASTQPLDDARLRTALVVWLVMVAIAGAAAYLIWRRLAHAKARFEHSVQVEEVLDPARWTTSP